MPHTRPTTDIAREGLFNILQNNLDINGMKTLDLFGGTGSISYELGTAAHDTVELRDGSVLSGDVESVSAAEVVLSVGGAIQHLNRNGVKRIVLIQREPPSS